MSNFQSLLIPKHKSAPCYAINNEAGINGNVFSLWAWQALDWYKNVYCGTELNAVWAKYLSYATEHKNQIRSSVEKYKDECTQNYLDSFSEKVRTHAPLCLLSQSLPDPFLIMIYEFTSST